MRLYLIALLSACLSLSAFSQSYTYSPGYTLIEATNVVDAGGNPLASGTATFQVVDGGGHPMSVQLGGFGQVHTAPVSVSVVNGAFTAKVVDVSATSPSFPCVSLTIVDNSTGSTVLSYNCLQPIGATYDLDMFSTNTTPVSPQAGDTVAGNLGVNGNLNVTGNLNLGGFSVGNLSATLLTAQNANGILNAAQFTGSDIGAKVNNAFASITSGGTVTIPPGAYSFATTINFPGAGYHLDCAAGTVLTYTGSTSALSYFNTSGLPTDTEVTGIDGHGGCLLQGTSRTGSGILINPSNMTYVTGMRVENFSMGINDAGGNGVEIFNNKLQNNHIGVHTITVPGFAPNAVHVHDNEFAGNDWGYLSEDGHVSATRALGNVIRDNVFEGEATGDIFLGWDARLLVEGNYFESCGVGVSVGVGTTNEFSVSVRDNYFSASACLRSEIELGSGFDFHISGNYEEATDVIAHTASSGCKVNVLGGEQFAVGQDVFNRAAEGTVNTPNNLCIGGVATNDIGGQTNIQTSARVGGILTVDKQASHIGPDTQNNGSIPVIWLGGVPVFVASFDPGGVCGTSTSGVNSGLWFTGDGIYVCQGTSPTSTTGVWTKK
jgi:hypothetical protein